MSTRNLHIAFPTPATFDDVRGGGERYVLNMARGLKHAASGRAIVEIVAPSNVTKSRELEPGITLRGVSASPPGAAYGQASSWHLIDSIVDSDVVHAHQAFTRFGEIASLAARIYGRVLCITDHGGMTSGIGKRVGLASLADAVVAYSECGASFFDDRSNVHVIEGGVDATYFRPGEAPSQRDRFVYAGRIMAHKGVDVLIRAAPPAVNVTVAGTAAQPSYLRLLQELSVNRDVTFIHDATDDALRSLYQRAIAVVLPSVHKDVYGNVYRYPELMGLTALEGMACGAPAVVMRTGGLPEYVQDGITGFVVENEQEMAKRLQQLVEDRSLAARLGDAARDRVLERWDLRVAGDSLLSLYEQLLRR